MKLNNETSTKLNAVILIVLFQFSTVNSLAFTSSFVNGDSYLQYSWLTPLSLIGILAITLLVLTKIDLKKFERLRKISFLLLTFCLGFLFFSSPTLAAKNFYLSAIAVGAGNGPTPSSVSLGSNFTLGCAETIVSTGNGAATANNFQWWTQYNTTPTGGWQNITTSGDLNFTGNTTVPSANVSTGTTAATLNLTSDNGVLTNKTGATMLRCMGYDWYNLALRTGTDIQNLTVTTTTPTYTNNVTNFTSPILFSGGYQFNITPFYPTGISQVTFESNFSSTPNNVTAQNQGSVYYNNTGALNDGTYYYKWYIKSVDNTWNSTPQVTFQVYNATLLVNWTLYNGNSQINATTCTSSSPCQYSQYNQFNASVNETSEDFEPLLIQNNGIYPINLTAVVSGDITNYVSLNPMFFTVNPGSAQIITLEFSTIGLHAGSIYTGQVLLYYSGQILESVPLELIVTTRYGKLLDVNVTLAKQFIQVTPGSQLNFQITVTNFGSIRPVDVLLVYNVTNNETLFSTSQTFALDVQKTIDQTFNIPSNAPPGTYTIEATAFYDSKNATSSVQFEVIQQPLIQWWLVGILIGTTIILSIGYVGYRRYSTRREIDKMKAELEQLEENLREAGKRELPIPLRKRILKESETKVEEVGEEVHKFISKRRKR